MSNVKRHKLPMVRTVLIIGTVIGSGFFMPVALLGVVIGFNGLRRPLQVPGFSGLWLIDLTYLLLGLGGVLGFSALLAAELAPSLVKRAGRLVQVAVLVGLAWGAMAALAVGALVTLSNSGGSATSVLSSAVGPGLFGLALVGLSSLWRTKRGA